MFERFRKFPTAITVADVSLEDAPLVFANHQFEEMTGYTSEEVVGKNCRFLQGEHTDPKAKALIGNAVRDQNVASITILNYRRDGTAFHNLLMLAPVNESLMIGCQYVFTPAVKDDELTEQIERVSGVFGKIENTPLTKVDMYRGIYETRTDAIRLIVDSYILRTRELRLTG